MDKKDELERVLDSLRTENDRNDYIIKGLELLQSIYLNWDIISTPDAQLSFQIERDTKYRIHNELQMFFNFDDSM